MFPDYTHSAQRLGKSLSFRELEVTCSRYTLPRAEGKRNLRTGDLP